MRNLYGVSFFLIKKEHIFGVSHPIISPLMEKDVSESVVFLH